MLFEAPTITELARRGTGGTGQRQSDRLTNSCRAPAKAQGSLGSDGDCRHRHDGPFPGANGIPQLWQNLLNRVESVTSFSDEELLASGVDPAVLRRPNYVKARPIIEGVDLFDASFFGYSPRDAELMDPQHRLLMETAWEALETAGYDSLRYDGSIGVFAGTNISSYLMDLYADPERRPPNMFEACLGNDKDSLTTKISYKLNLKGPSFAVQTFCSILWSPCTSPARACGRGV